MAKSEGLKDAERNGRAWAKEITRMMRKLRKARDIGDDKARDEAGQEISGSPLSIEVRTGWYTPGQRYLAGADEFCILLSTGGPALRIIGTLSQHDEPETARMQVQCWGIPWCDLNLSVGRETDVLEFAQFFSFYDHAEA